MYPNLFSTDKGMAFLPRQSQPLGTGTRAGQRLLWHKEHPAGGLQSAFVNRPCKGDRGSKAGPDPASLQGGRRWRWRCGSGGARNNVFVSKTLRVLGSDFQPCVYSICSRVHDRFCLYLCLSLQVSVCVFACSVRVYDHTCGRWSLCVCRRPSEKNGSGFHLCELFRLKTWLK